MKVVLTSLANFLFEGSQLRLVESAKHFGITDIRSYDFEEIKTSDFYRDNKEILSDAKTMGYWLWKPYIILEVIKTLSENDIVIYCDAGIEIIKNLNPLIDLCIDETSILLFANSNLTNKEWTKRDCFVLMNCDENKYWNGLQCDAALCIFRKTERTVKFLKEWLFYGSNANIITDLPNVSGSKDLPGFIEHRRDQSILSLLAIKYKLPLYRMPTQFGNHYKLPEYRVENEFNCINQAHQTQVDYYSSSPFHNSRYYQLLNHHREKNAIRLNQANQSTPDLQSRRSYIACQKMATPFYSIIIPTYNASRTLSKCLDSLIMQSFQNFEILIMDGGSMDDTMAIVKKYETDHINIRWFSAQDKGIYDAMNKGIKLAKGEWIYFLGSDDRLYENSTLKKLTGSISECPADMIYGNVLIEGESIWAKDEQIYNGEYCIEKLLKNNICHQAAFYKRKLLVKLGGYNIDYVVCADWDINFNFFANYKIQYTEQIIAFFTSSGLSSIKVYDKFLENDIVINLKTYFGWSLFNKHFFSWKHILKKNANEFFKKGNVFKGFIYLAAYKYHNLKSA